MSEPIAFLFCKGGGLLVRRRKGDEKWDCFFQRRRRATCPFCSVVATNRKDFLSIVFTFSSTSLFKAELLPQLENISGTLVIYTKVF